MRDYRIKTKTYDHAGWVIEKSEYYCETPDELFEKIQTIHPKDFWECMNDDDTIMGYLTYDEGGFMEVFVYKWNNFDTTEKERYTEFFKKVEKFLS